MVVDKKYDLLPVSGAENIAKGDVLEYDAVNNYYIKLAGGTPCAIAAEDYTSGSTPAFIKAMVAGDIFKDEVNDTLSETDKYNLRGFSIYVTSREVY
jgi:hypothetical protein